MFTDRVARLLQRALDRLKDPDEAREWLAQRVRVENRWSFELVRNGRVIDEFGFENLVVNAGLNALLGRTFDVVGSNVLWYAGLIGAGTGTVSITASANA